MLAIRRTFVTPIDTLASSALKSPNSIRRVTSSYCQCVGYSTSSIAMASYSKENRNRKFGHLPLATSGPQNCAITGAQLLNTSYMNKGSAFTNQERNDFGLTGLLPCSVQTLEEQVRRAYKQYSSRNDALAKNTFMTSMKNQNEVLYYRLLQDHLKEMFSVIYTPTEGDAIQNYSRLFRKPSGCYLSIEEPDSINKALSQWGEADDIDLIVVSDGEQILGIGDQGVGAILISEAKLVIYTLCAGIHPHRTLPIVLDCGTDNPELLNDNLYLGLRKSRVRGQEYDDFFDNFIKSARRQYPKAYIHCEDFGVSNARRILDKYRDEVPMFNDDVQGTGCVTLAAIMAALHVTKTPMSDLRVLCYGAGSAGTGIADQISRAIAVESGKSKDKADEQIWCVDKPGLLLKSHKDSLTPAQHPYARDDADWRNTDTKDLQTLIKHIKPHVLIGTSTQPKAFTELVVKEMAAHVDRPIIFPLSNPTRLHEASPKDLNDWTNGTALIATGSPFPPVEHNGVSYEVAECNNSTTFPGIGLGAVLSRANRMTDAMLVAATKALAAQAPALKDPDKGLLPDVGDVREISVIIAMAVIRKAVEEGVSTEKDIPLENDEELEEWIREQMWDPRYRSLRKVSAEGAGKMARGVAGLAGSARDGQKTENTVDI